MSDYRRSANLPPKTTHEEDAGRGRAMCIGGGFAVGLLVGILASSPGSASRQPCVLYHVPDRAHDRWVHHGDSAEDIRQAMSEEVDYIWKMQRRPVLPVK